MCRRTASYKVLTIAGTITSPAAYVCLILLWRGKTNIWESLHIGPGGFGTGVILAKTLAGLASGAKVSDMKIARTDPFLGCERS